MHKYSKGIIALHESIREIEAIFSRYSELDLHYAKTGAPKDAFGDNGIIERRWAKGKLTLYWSSVGLIPLQEGEYRGFVSAVLEKPFVRDVGFQSSVQVECYLDGSKAYLHDTLYGVGSTPYFRRENRVQRKLKMFIGTAHGMYPSH